MLHYFNIILTIKNFEGGVSVKYENRSVLITGAGGGIGRAICRQLHAAGVRIIACDRTLQEAQKAVNELSGTCAAYEMDVASSSSVAKAAQKISSDVGKIDILINNAGVWRYHPFTETPEEKWREIIEINLCGTIRVTQAFLPQMIRQKYGRIINLGSIAGEVGLPYYFDYAASKAGVILFTKTLAMEYGQTGITVNCVSPGMISAEDGKVSPSNGTWVGREGSREEVANLICFLAADESGFITGVDYTIDGGRILGPKQTV